MYRKFIFSAASFNLKYHTILQRRFLVNIVRVVVLLSVWIFLLPERIQACYHAPAYIIAYFAQNYIIASDMALWSSLLLFCKKD